MAILATDPNILNRSGAKTEFRLVLGSPSPARMELLQQLDISVEVVPGELEELLDTSNFEALVQSRALMQATRSRIISNASTVDKNRLQKYVLGLDTIIVVDGEIITRPKSVIDARKMLIQLSGKTHKVVTGIAIISPDNRTSCSLQTTEVTFREIEAAELDAYLKTSDPLYNIGGYSLQGPGGIFVKGINGCYANALGVPLPSIASVLRGLGMPVLGM